MLYVYVAAGGAFGALSRYLVFNAMHAHFGKGFPYATMVVNIVGSLLMGIVIGIIMTMLPKGREFYIFMAVGVLGGFTTFSAFTYDAYMLLERGEHVLAGIYIIGTFGLSLLGFLLGMWLFRVLS